MLTRLRPSRSYRYEVVGASHQGGFETEPLPADLLRLRLRESGAPTLPLVMLHLFSPDGFKGYCAVDAEAQVVWYWRTLDNPFGMTRRASGNFVFMDRARGLCEVTPHGETVRELAQDLAAREMHHDVIATPADTLLFLAFDTRADGGAPVKGEAVWEWAPERGSVVKRWSSWDQLSPASDRGPRFTSEWMHANSLAFGPRRNVVLSAHFLDQVISIAPDWSGIEWRLGGVNATHALGEAERFSGQHTAQEIATDRVLLFDNRHQQGGYSRAVELELRPGGARPVWQWTPPGQGYAHLVSSARRLWNGNTLVAFGLREGLEGSTGTEAFEVAPGGEVLWHLELDGVQVMYRVEPLFSLGGEW
jgi:hypothetical protein